MEYFRKKIVEYYKAMYNKDFKLLAFSEESKFTPFYERGTGSDVISIYFTNGHYYPIDHLTTLFRCKNYCTDCKYLTL
jgi:hypothetical protein